MLAGKAAPPFILLIGWQIETIFSLSDMAADRQKARMADKTTGLSHDNLASPPAMNVGATLKTIGVLLAACGGIASLAWEKTTAGNFLIAAGFLTYLAVLISEWWEKK